MKYKIGTELIFRKGVSITTLAYQGQRAKVIKIDGKVISCSYTKPGSNIFSNETWTNLEDMDKRFILARHKQTLKERLEKWIQKD